VGRRVEEVDANVVLILLVQIQFPRNSSRKNVTVEELYGTQYQSGSLFFNLCGEWFLTACVVFSFLLM